MCMCVTNTDVGCPHQFLSVIFGGGVLTFKIIDVFFSFDLMYVCVCVGVPSFRSVHHVCEVSILASRGRQIPGEWACKGLCC